MSDRERVRARSSLELLRYPSWPRVLGRRRRRVAWPAGLVPYASSALTISALVVVLYLAPLFRSSGSAGRDLPWMHTVPIAENGVDLELGPLVVLDASGLSLDEHALASVAELDAAATPLPALRDALAALDRQWSILHPRDPFPGTLLVAGDADVPYARVRRVITTSALTRYTRISFIVRRPNPMPIELDAFTAVFAE